MTTNKMKALLESLSADQLVEIRVLIEYERIRRYGRRSERGIAGEGNPEAE